jgi:hypothetical protein
LFPRGGRRSADERTFRTTRRRARSPPGRTTTRGEAPIKKSSFVALLLVGACALAGAGTATAEGPTREVFEGGSNFVTDVCGFPVHWESSGRFAVLTFTDEDGNLFRTIEPAAGVFQVQLTNLGTDESLTLNISGPGMFQVYEDGSFSFTTFGPWLVIRNPVTLEFGLFVIQGRRERFEAATGEVTFTFHGHIRNLCTELAS